jgi:hypothetical protein
MRFVTVRLGLSGLLVLALTAVQLAAPGILAPSPAAAQEACIFFPETGHTLCGGFRS